MGQFPTMGIEGVAPGKSHIFEVGHRTLAGAGFHHGAFAFADMGMQHNALVTGKRHGLHHRVLVTVDGLARGHHDLPHAETVGIMVGVDDPLTIGDELIGAFKHGVGNCGAFGFWQGVPAAPRVKPQTQQIRCFELAVDQAFARVPGKAILVIHRCGAPVFDQFCHRRKGRVVEAFLGQTREDGINQVKPLDHRQLGPVEIGAVTHKCLKEMMVGVHKPRVDEPAGRVPYGGTGGFKARSNCLDRRTFGQQIYVPQNFRAFAMVHNDRGAVSEEHAHHPSASAKGSGANSCKR